LILIREGALGLRAEIGERMKPKDTNRYCFDEQPKKEECCMGFESLFSSMRTTDAIAHASTLT
jgi:hypothetical protein